MKKEGKPRRRFISPYLFEPSLEDVVSYFNDEIFAVLLTQTIDESWLSLLGSRITAMERASQNIEDRLKRLTIEARKEERRIQNKKQRERLAGISLWG